MKISEFVQCIDFPCEQAKQESYLIPDIDIEVGNIQLMLISETAPNEPKDGYYGDCEGLFARTTLQAFGQAGVKATDIQDLLRMGIYLTTAVKCGKYDYAVDGATIKHCTSLLEREMGLFPNIRAYLLMGDVAIKAFNTIAMRQGEGRIIPAGSTYKIRGGVFTYRGSRVFPSYLQAGASFGIEKSKVRMIVDDIASAMNVVRHGSV